MSISRDERECDQDVNCARHKQWTAVYQGFQLTLMNGGVAIQQSLLTKCKISVDNEGFTVLGGLDRAAIKYSDMLEHSTELNFTFIIKIEGCSLLFIPAGSGPSMSIRNAHGTY